MSSYNYHQPARELLSLKTDDIPGARGKSKIHERRLVNKTRPNSYHPRAQQNCDNFGRNRMYESIKTNMHDLPDAYELEGSIKQSLHYDGKNLHKLSNAIKNQVVYSRERMKYKLPNEREIFLHNYENLQKFQLQNNRRRYKSNISYDSPFFKGIIIPPALKVKGPIKLPKRKKMTIPDNVSDSDLNSVDSDEPPQVQGNLYTQKVKDIYYTPADVQKREFNPVESMVENYDKFNQKYNGGGFRDKVSRDVVASHVINPGYQQRPPLPQQDMGYNGGAYSHRGQSNGTYGHQSQQVQQQGPTGSYAHQQVAQGNLNRGLGGQIDSIDQMRMERNTNGFHNERSVNEHFVRMERNPAYITSNKSYGLF